VTHATVLRIETNPEGSRVERLRVASRPEREWTVVPEIVILASGAVENARILLLSATPGPGPHSGGVGNANDLVGRYFAEHAVIKRAATALCWRSSASLRVYLESHSSGSMIGNARGVIAPSEQTLRKERLRNCMLMPRELKKKIPVRAEVASVAGSMDRRLSTPASITTPTNAMTIHTAFETEPNPNNRVKLIDRRDRFGQRKIRLRWIPSADDLRSIRRNLELFGQDLGASGLGRLHISDRIRVKKVRGNNHHLGTTRMHVSPKLGVVDPQCRVHDVGNLYVAGSSVFPAYGYANPTFTIVALALRLVDQLRPKLAATAVSARSDGGSTA
jgi:choline dehydrogenase-like flavoprotein